MDAQDLTMISAAQNAAAEFTTLQNKYTRVRSAILTSAKTALRKRL